MAAGDPGRLREHPSRIPRNHFGIPVLDANAWRLKVGGLVRRRLGLGPDELKRFGSVSVAAVLEYAGNGGSGYVPAVPGEQSVIGAVGNATWTGRGWPTSWMRRASGARRSRWYLSSRLRRPS